MKKLLIPLAIIGFIVPNIYNLKVTFETGNILLWTDPRATIHGLFGNDISTAFIIDLFVVVITFFAWTWYEAKKLKIKNVWRIWVLTLLFGMGGSFCLFLYWREKKLKDNPVSA